LSVYRQFIADSKLVITHPSAASFDAIQSHANWTTVFLGILVIGVAYAGAGLIGTFMGFFISLGVAMLVARALGGVGDFKTYAYAISVFDVPLGIADAASILIPPISPIVFIVGLGYSIYLGVLATSSVHRLSTGKSVLVYMISLVTKIAIALSLLAAIALFIVIAVFGHH
jgi:hypothetical protein